MSAGRFRRDAVLTFRCADCAASRGDAAGGLVIAHVNYRAGKAMLWTHGPRPNTSGWTELDDRPRTVAAWCRWGKYWIDLAALLPDLPAPGERVTHTVDHTMAGRYSRKDAGTLRTVKETRERFGMR